MIIKCILPWPISVTYAIICTGHPIFKTCHTIITYLMLLSTKIMLLSHTSCYYQQKSCYYQTPHAIIHKSYVIIVQLVLLSDISTTHLLSNISCYYQTPHVIIKQIMLLSNNSCYYQTPHVIINTSTYYPYTLYDTILPNEASQLLVAQLVEHSLNVQALGLGFKPRSGIEFFGLFWGFQRRWSWIWLSLYGCSY